MGDGGVETDGVLGAAVGEEGVAVAEGGEGARAD